MFSIAAEHVVTLSIAHHIRTERGVKRTTTMFTTEHVPSLLCGDGDGTVPIAEHVLLQNMFSQGPLSNLRSSVGRIWAEDMFYCSFAWM